MDGKNGIEDFKLSLKRKLSSSEDGSDDEAATNELVYFEEESESEPEHECDTWDETCKVVEIKTSKSVIGYHLMPTCARDIPKKIKLSPEMRFALLEPNFTSTFKTNWNSLKKFNCDKVELIVDPFKVCIINDFLQNGEYLTELRQEFNEIQWNTRNMDLYEFFQSKDLTHLSNKLLINAIYKFLQTDVMKWVADLTGMELTHISATCSLYSHTDYLLVHDDQREDRMIAFVLYLSDNWDETKGGALQLFAKDAAGQPSHITRSIFPANNQLVFFPVTNDSYHQVAEVTSLNDCRLSINGWFHSKTPPTFKTPQFTPYPDGLYGDQPLKPLTFDVDVSSWINNEYLNCKVMGQIQEYFEENSEICLKNFLNANCFNELLQTLQLDCLNWVRIGPPNRYCYEVIAREELPGLLDRLLNLFQSKQMFYLLQRFTGLELEKATASMKFELQRWTPGSYALLTDHDWQAKKELDLLLSFGCKNSSDVVGGRTQYVTVDEEVQNALITIDPDENNLNIVYRDTARFTKYFSKLSVCSCFYTLICSYSE